MKIIAKSGIDYVPEFNGNHKLPKNSQVVIEWNYLSGNDREIVMGIGPIKFDASGEIKDEYIFRIDNMELLRKSIRVIKNLTIEEDEKERVCTVDEISRMPELGGLYRELVDFFLEQNRTEGKKK